MQCVPTLNVNRTHKNLLDKMSNFIGGEEKTFRLIKCKSSFVEYIFLFVRVSFHFFLSNIKFTQPFQEVSEEISTVVGMAPFRCLVSTFDENTTNIIGLEIFVVFSFKICFVCTFSQDR